MTAHTFESEVGKVDDAIALQEHFYTKGWTDGLPVVPPTPERVAQFLTAAGREPSDIITVIPTRNRVVTAEKVAINSVMAGCLPEYMPVIIAVLEAMSEPAFQFHGSITSTGGAAPFIVVNGPIRLDLLMNSGANTFGPGNRANSTIGRAIRLIIINVAGAIPGILDKSTQGHGGKYSFCFAEAEERSPWEPFHVEKGFDSGTSTVTVYAAEAPHSIQNHDSDDPEELMLCIAAEMASIGAFSNGQSAIVLSPEHADIIARCGWSKQDIKAFIFEHATQPFETLVRLGKCSREDAGRILVDNGMEQDEETRLISLKKRETADPGGQDMIHRGFEPDDIILVVAGGLAGGHSAFVPSWSRGRASLFQTKVVQQYRETFPMA